MGRFCTTPLLHLERSSIYASFPSSSVVVPKPVWHSPSAASRPPYGRLKDADFRHFNFAMPKQFPAMSQCPFRIQLALSRRYDANHRRGITKPLIGLRLCNAYYQPNRVRPERASRFRRFLFAASKYV